MDTDPPNTNANDNAGIVDHRGNPEHGRNLHEINQRITKLETDKITIEKVIAQTNARVELLEEDVDDIFQRQHTHTHVIMCFVSILVGTAIHVAKVFLR